MKQLSKTIKIKLLKHCIDNAIYYQKQNLAIGICALLTYAFKRYNIYDINSYVLRYSPNELKFKELTGMTKYAFKRYGNRLGYINYPNHWEDRIKLLNGALKKVRRINK